MKYNIQHMVNAFQDVANLVAANPEVFKPLLKAENYVHNDGGEVEDNDVVMDFEVPEARFFTSHPPHVLIGTRRNAWRGYSSKQYRVDVMEFQAMLNSITKET